VTAWLFCYYDERLCRLASRVAGEAGEAPKQAPLRLCGHESRILSDGGRTPEVASTVPDEIMTAIAVALAGKTADAVFSGSKEAFAGLVRLLRQRFGHDDKARKVLKSAQHAPDDPAAIDALARELDRLASSDPEIARQVSQLRTSVAQGRVLNMVTGSVNHGIVIQARDIDGGIHIGNT
jgi:hypothetical protein